MARVTKAHDKQGFAFATKVYDHHQQEFRRFLRFGTPGPDLVDLGQDVSGEVFPPFTLASSKGVKHALKCFKLVEVWKKSIAYMAWSLREVGHQLAQAARESRSRELGKALVDIILTRSAMRRNPEVILCFESAQVGIQALTGEKISIATVRSLFELISVKGSPFAVTFGKRGEFKRATKVVIELPVHSAEIVKLAEKHKNEVDDWLLERGQWVVRVMQHEELLRAFHDDRKAEYMASVHRLVAEAEEYIRQHSRIVPGSRMVEVGLPGIDSLHSVSSATAVVPAAPSGITILTSDSEVPETGADLHEEENHPQPGGTLFEPVEQDPETYFWELQREWEREQRRANNHPIDSLDQADYDRMLAGITL